MTHIVGSIDSLHRYPIKSMAGEPLDAADVTWHGLDGDRRLAIRRLAERGGFPWLTASRLAELVTFVPVRREGVIAAVRLPDGRELAIDGAELRAELSARHGAEVELMALAQGVFDEAPVSVLATSTLGTLGAAVGRPLDVRRFRPNIVIRTAGRGYEEDAWVGGVLEVEGGPALAVIGRDVRCVMINLDPETAASDPAVLKAAVRLNDNNAGVYATVLRTGTLRVGQRVTLRR